MKSKLQDPKHGVRNEMYQLEVKWFLIEKMFSPSNGWDVIVDIDPMELAKGPQQRSGKRERAAKAEEALKRIGVKIGAHPIYGRADVVASHPEYGTFIIEVEGKSSRQREQAVYSALGQSLLMMKDNSASITYGVALPGLPEWKQQIVKIPHRIKEMLRLKCFLVSEKEIKEI
jgi:hypothetical protein